MAVPQFVFNDDAAQRFEMPKSVIFTQIGESDAMRMFCWDVSVSHLDMWRSRCLEWCGIV